MRLFTLFGILLLLLPVMPASAQSSYDVTLVSDDAVYSWQDAHYGATPFANTPFANLIALPNGNFVSGGQCNSTVRGNVLPYSYSIGGYEDKGMHVFSGDGDLIDEVDVCFDSSVRAPGCFELGGCSAGSAMIPYSNNEFVRDLHPGGSGYPRSPIAYRVGASSVSRLGRVFFNDWGGVNFNPGGVRSLTNVAVVGDIMFARRITSQSNNGGAIADDATWAYQLPNMSAIGVVESGGFTPHFGLGDFLIAGETEFATRKLYEVDQSDGSLTYVRDLPEIPRTAVVSYDPTDLDRVVVTYSLSASNYKMDVWEASANGISRTASYTPQGNLSGIGLNVSPVAILGDTIAYPSCGPSNARDCRLAVMQNGQHVSVEPLPQAVDFNNSNTTFIHSVSISPAGTIMVALRGNPDIVREPWTGQCQGNTTLGSSAQCYVMTDDLDAFAGLYLYEIGSGGGGGGTVIIDDPSGDVEEDIPSAGGSGSGSSLASLFTQLSLSELYAEYGLQTPEQRAAASGGGSTGNTNDDTLRRGATGEAVRSLQQQLNTVSGVQVAVSGPGAPGFETTYFGSATEAALKAFQCQYNITCGGTGYGVYDSTTAEVLASVSISGQAQAGGQQNQISLLQAQIAQIEAQIAALLGL